MNNFSLFISVSSIAVGGRRIDPAGPVARVTQLKTAHKSTFIDLQSCTIVAYVWWIVSKFDRHLYSILQRCQSNFETIHNGLGLDRDCCDLAIWYVAIGATALGDSLTGQFGWEPATQKPGGWGLPVCPDLITTAQSGTCYPLPCQSAASPLPNNNIKRPSLACGRKGDTAQAVVCDGMWLGSLAKTLRWETFGEMTQTQLVELDMSESLRRDYIFSMDIPH